MFGILCCISEFASFKPPFRDDDDDVSVTTDYQDYDPAKHNPVFYGNMHHQVTYDLDCMQDVDVAKSHPTVVGYAFTDKPPESPKPPPPPLPDKKTCKSGKLDLLGVARNCMKMKPANRILKFSAEAKHYPQGCMYAQLGCLAN